MKILSGGAETHSKTPTKSGEKSGKSQGQSQAIDFLRIKDPEIIPGNILYKNRGS